MKELQLQFITETGSTASISIDQPKEPIDTEEVRNAMEEIIASEVFYSPGGRLIAGKNLFIGCPIKWLHFHLKGLLFGQPFLKGGIDGGYSIFIHKRCWFSNCCYSFFTLPN